MHEVAFGVFLAVFLFTPPASALRTRVVVSEGLSEPVALVEFGLRADGTVFVTSADSPPSKGINVTLCTAAQLRPLTATSQTPTWRQLTEACEWSGALGIPHSAETTAEYTVLAWSPLLGGTGSAVLEVLLLNPGKYAHLSLGEKPLPVFSDVSLVAWGVALIAWGVVCLYARTTLSAPHHCVTGLLALKVGHLSVVVVFWKLFVDTGFREKPLRVSAATLDALTETVLFALLLSLAEGWRIVSLAARRGTASWSSVRSAVALLILLCATLLLNAFWNDGYSLLSVIVIYFFLLPRVFSAVVRSTRTLLTYRALFAALGISARQLRFKLRAMRAIRGLSVFYFVAALLALSLTSLLPFFATWGGIMFRETARFVVVISLAIVINPAGPTAVLADINNLGNIDELPAMVVAARRPHATSDDPFTHYVERVQKGDVAVFRLPTVTGQQGPRIALGVRRVSTTTSTTTSSSITSPTFKASQQPTSDSAAATPPQTQSQHV